MTPPKKPKSQQKQPYPYAKKKGVECGWIVFAGYKTRHRYRFGNIGLTAKVWGIEYINCCYKQFLKWLRNPIPKKCPKDINIERMVIEIVSKKRLCSSYQPYTGELKVFYPSINNTTEINVGQNLMQAMRMTYLVLAENGVLNKKYRK